MADTGGHQRAAGDAQPGLTALVAQVTVARATELARRGRYERAEQLIDTLSPAQRSAPTALDILARIRAQRGDLLGAASLWHRALEQDPHNEAYRAALGRIGGLQRRPRWTSVLLPLILTVLVGAGVVWAGLWADSRFGAIETSQRSHMAMITRAIDGVDEALDGVEQKQKALAAQVDELAADEAELARTLQGRADRLDGQLAWQKRQLGGLHTQVQRLRDQVSELETTPAH
ncbi:MAG: hypothetical protein U9R79_09565 [Armatimonadota bacterium]|nr:hypothetical protein [Armatimonadota bacterium]